MGYQHKGDDKNRHKKDEAPNWFRKFAVLWPCNNRQDLLPAWNGPCTITFGNCRLSIPEKETGSATAAIILLTEDDRGWPLKERMARTTKIITSQKEEKPRRGKSPRPGAHRRRRKGCGPAGNNVTGVLPNDKVQNDPLPSTAAGQWVIGQKTTAQDDSNDQKHQSLDLPPDRVGRGYRFCLFCLIYWPDSGS